jgi:uncharacterized protein
MGLLYNEIRYFSITRGTTLVSSSAPLTKAKYSTAAYVAPIAIFVGVMALEQSFRVPPEIGYPIRLAATVLGLIVFSRSYIDLHPIAPLASILAGLFVFAVWVGPDILFGYRNYWLFHNKLTGAATTSLGPGLFHNTAFLFVRAAGSTLVVPVIEELFWRAWLMRWLIDRDIEAVPLGTYAPAAFWLTAILFASEHGPFWDVGLAAGVVYNWWMVRRKSLADCILAHAVTNGVLAAYVVFGGHWQYWL